MRKACWLFGLLLAATAGVVPAQTVRYDSSAVALRTLAPEALTPYRTDDAYRYDREPPEADSWLDRLRRWLGEQLVGPLGEETTGRLIRWLLYALAAFGLFFAVTRLLRMEAGWVFSRGRRPPGVTLEALEEDLHAMDFDRLIEEAVSARNYRRAVRLLYLHALRQLTDAGLIDWQRDKTNRAYVDELRRPALRPAFRELTILFEYIWYGDFPVQEATFARCRRAFNRFAGQVQEAGL